MKEGEFNVPRFYYGSSKEDIEAHRALLESGMPCNSSGVAEEPTPLLVVGYQRFLGLEEILKYISELK